MQQPMPSCLTAIRKKIKVVTVLTLVVEKCKGGYGGAYGGVWPSLHSAGVRSRVAGLVFVHLAGIHFINFCTYSAICIRNNPTNNITVQHKKFYSRQI
jgi:hypothetical protein